MSIAHEDYIAGTVVKLDRGFPLVRLDSAAGSRAMESSLTFSCETEAPQPSLVRCEHATSLVKEHLNRAVIGDKVRVRLEDTHDKGIIQEIEPRQTEFVRRDPADRTAKQVLAANFSQVIIAEPLVDLNYRRLERELVLAHETGAHVMIVLTKNDLINPSEGAAVIRKVCDLAGSSVEVLTVSAKDEASMNNLREQIPEGQLAILIGKSGVGKSTLVNLLSGQQVQETAAVRERDGKGRHTTVDRTLVDLPGGGAVVDMPGVRGLGIWDADQGLTAAFSDIYALAESCRFRDCAHINEPGCAVLAAVEDGTLAQARLDSYHSLVNELAKVKQQRVEVSRMQGVKHGNKQPKRKV